MRKIFFVTVGLLVAGCASQPAIDASVRLPQFPGRNLASISGVVPAWAAGAVAPREVVDAVIARLGPVHSQRNTQFCFAYAGADMATYQTGQRVSAFSVLGRNFANRSGFDYVFFNPGGVLASQVGPDSRFMLGLASSVLRTNLMGSLCTDDQPRDDLTYRDQTFKRLWDGYDTYRAYVGPTKPDNLYQAVMQQLMLISPTLDAQDFTEHMSRYQPLDYALAAWFDRQCHVKVEQKLEVVGSEVGHDSADQVVASLDKALESGQIAMIHYDPGVLGSEEPSVLQAVIGFHVSSIVARAKIAGNNFYLLRNSWGESCNRYGRSMTGRCDRGHFWLTEEEVRKYVTSVAYYLPK